MNLPFELQKSIDRLISAESFSQLKIARQNLTHRYQNQFAIDDLKKASMYFMKNKQEILTYLATRMPATYAVSRKILMLLNNYEPSIESLLDLGAGPGTVFWASQNILSSLKKIVMIEQDDVLIEIAQQLLANSSLHHSNIRWQKKSLLNSLPFENHDLITLSYVLGEIASKDQLKIIQAVWQATDKFLIIIEPGTPQGFKLIRQIRQFLIDQGAFILAPCPHQLECPIKDQNWCHFSQRLERSTSHRLIKKTDLSYEDEKFSYIIASRMQYQLPPSRILSHPQRKKGHFILDLCTSNGIKRHIVPKKMKKSYQEARHYEWGDSGPDLDNKNHDS